METVVNYELYIHRDGKWELASRFEESNKQAAIDEAMHYEQLAEKPTKLVKETFNPHTGQSSDTVVYLSERIRNNEQSLFAATSPQNGSTDFFSSEEENSPSILEPEPLSKKTLLHMKLTGIIIGSTVFSLIISFGLTTVVQNALRSSFGSMSGSSHMQIFAGTFLITLIITATPLVLKAISKADRNRKKKRKNQKPSKSVFELFIEYLLAPTDTQNKLEDEKLDAYIRKEEAKQEALSDNDGMLDLDELAEKYDYADGDEVDASEKEKAKKAKKLQEESKRAKEKASEKQSRDYEEQRQEFVDEDDFEQENNETNEKKKDTPDALAHKFLQGVISEIKHEYPTLDSYGRFALNLLLAGACDTIQAATFINDTTYKRTLKNVIMATGASEAVASSFCEKLTEHSSAHNQARIIETGSVLMKSMMDKDLAAFSCVIDVFRNWYSPIQENSTNFHDIVTVMFTDIIGSTNFTETLGDVTAQQLIRAHNAVVRNALYEFNGIEIKHTGDGIMASFSSATSAVEAAARIQQSIEEFNHNNRSKFPLHVRIGLNSGEPIAEDDDLFGLTVQMAARICNAGSEKQIFVSEVVKELAAGKPNVFEDMGVFKLKGVQEPQRLFSINWEAVLQEMSDAIQKVYEASPENGITVSEGAITAHGSAEQTAVTSLEDAGIAKSKKPAFDEFSEVNLYKIDEENNEEKKAQRKAHKPMDNLESFD